MTGRTTPPFPWATATIAATGLAFVAPIVVDLVINKQPRLFGYLAADTFYYLVVARNHNTTGDFTFDGEHLTNGYHPLWQWLLSPLHALISAVAPDSLLLVLVALGVVLISLALVWLARAWTRSDGYLSPLFPLVVPGVVALISTPFYQPENDHYFFDTPETARPVFTTMWSHPNGMETPLLVLAFCASAWFFLRKQQLLRAREAVLFGVLLLLVVFSRLDHVFFAGTLLCGMAGWAWARGDRTTVRHSLLAGAVLGLGVGLYLLNNKLVYGTAMPISGLIKASNPASASTNLRHLANLLDDPAYAVVAVASRGSQVVFPLLIALFYILCSLRIGPRPPFFRMRAGRDSRTDVFLLWTALAVVALGLYDLLGVHFMSQGNWYLPISSLFASLVVLQALDRLTIVQRLARSRLALGVWLPLCLLATSAYFMRAHYHPQYQVDFARYYFEEAPRIREMYSDRPAPKILEFSDGIIGYATEFPVMSGAGFMLDVAALPAQKSQTLLSLAVERGFDRISNLLAGKFPIRGKITRQRILEIFPRIGFKDFEKFDFIPEYRSTDGDGVIFRVVPRPPGSPPTIPSKRPPTRSIPRSRPPG